VLVWGAKHRGRKWARQHSWMDETYFHSWREPLKLVGWCNVVAARAPQERAKRGLAQCHLSRECLPAKLRTPLGMYECNPKRISKVLQTQACQHLHLSVCEPVPSWENYNRCWVSSKRDGCERINHRILQTHSCGRRGGHLFRKRGVSIERSDCDVFPA
jgi:hypothetical protein